MQDRAVFIGLCLLCPSLCLCLCSVVSLKRDSDSDCVLEQGDGYGGVRRGRQTEPLLRHRSGEAVRRVRDPVSETVPQRPSSFRHGEASPAGPGQPLKPETQSSTAPSTAITFSPGLFPHSVVTPLRHTSIRPTVKESLAEKIKFVILA